MWTVVVLTTPKWKFMAHSSHLWGCTHHPTMTFFFPTWLQPPVCCVVPQPGRRNSPGRGQPAMWPARHSGRDGEWQSVGKTQGRIRICLTNPLAPCFSYSGARPYWAGLSDTKVKVPTILISWAVDLNRGPFCLPLSNVQTLFTGTTWDGVLLALSR